jgi:hypothetical protein
MVFDTKQINGITISEDDEPREFRFAFTNSGRQPLVITRVETSCGCTIASYDKKPIPAGGSGEIELVFHPRGVAGRLARVISVYTSDSGAAPAARLELNGEVTPTADKWAARYPVLLGGMLRAKRDSVAFGTVLETQRREERIECVNVSNRPLTPSLVRSMAPEWLTLETEPATIAPGEVADVVIKIDGRQLHASKTDGRIDLTLILKGLGGRPSECSLYVSGELGKD